MVVYSIEKGVVSWNRQKLNKGGFLYCAWNKATVFQTPPKPLLPKKRSGLRCTREGVPVWMYMEIIMIELDKCDARRKVDVETPLTKGALTQENTPFGVF